MVNEEKREMGEKSESTLDGIFGPAEVITKEKDVLMVDRPDSEEEDEDTDGYG